VSRASRGFYEFFRRADFTSFFVARILRISPRGFLRNFAARVFTNFAAQNLRVVTSRLRCQLDEVVLLLVLRLVGSVFVDRQYDGDQPENRTYHK